MSNTILTPTIITRKALMAFVNSLVFAKGANRQYDSQFANSGASPSGKIGPTLTIRKPNRFQVSTGAALQVKDVSEQSTTFTISTRKHVDFVFPTQDLTLSIDDFMDRYVNRAVETLANEVDYDGLALYKDCPNVVANAIPSTTPAAALIWLQAKQKLQEFSMPTSGVRYAVMNPAAEAATVNGLTTLFNSQTKIAKQYDEGEMGEALGLQFKMDQNVNTHVCGTRAASSESTVDVTSADGASTIDLATGSGVTFKQGDVFTVNGVYAVNAQSKKSTGSLQQFTVTEDYTATGTAANALPIYPATVLTGARQNVNKLPTNGDAVIFVSAASKNVPQNLVYHQDAATLVTADLEMPQGVHFAGREQYDGISLRIVRQYDISSDTIPCRIDILYGWKLIYPEWMCRVVGAEA